MQAKQLNTQFINESEVQNVIALKETLKELKKRVESIQLALSDTESKIVEKLDSGAVIPRGYDLTISTISRRFPAWKEFFISRLGKAEADLVLEQTEPKVYRNLNIKAA